MAQNAINTNIDGMCLLVASAKDLIEMKKDVVRDLTANLEKHQRDLTSLQDA